VTDVLDDARVYSNHAKKKAIDGEDVRLAVQYKLEYGFTTPPPKDVRLCCLS
jgi:histone H3/H4